MIKKNPYIFKILHKQIPIMIFLSLVPGIGYILLGWVNNVITPALVWYGALALLSLWGYFLYKRFDYEQMSYDELHQWHAVASFFYYFIFTSWAVIFFLYANETQGNMHYIAIFTELGASVVASTLLFPERRVLRPVLLILMMPLTIYFSLIGELYGYVLTVFSLVFTGVLYYAASSSDRLLQRTHFQASHDQLTKLLNRHAFIEELQQKVNGLERKSCFSYLLLIDLDHFKTINDTLGHDIGDEILQEASLRLQTIAGTENTIARLGGDEFVVLAKDFKDERESLDDAMLLAHRLLDSLKQTYHIKEHQLYLSASIGASQLSNKKLNANVFIKEADIAMYEVKEQGRDGVILFNNELSKRVEKNLELEQKLHFSLKENEISLNYQPQVNANNKVIGAEVLARWENKDLGIVRPDTFIPIAEQTGFMIDLGLFIIENAFKTLREWSEQGIELEQFSINISMRQFFYYKFIDDIEYLTQFYLTPELTKKVIFEMTETILAEDIPRVVSVIKSLQALGIRFSMDDFGTGYSSLSYLQQMPIHELKIDKSFVNMGYKGKVDEKMVNIIMNMARAFKLSIVAEGVETEEQMNFLVAHGCNVLQGFFFSRPLCKEDFITFFLETNK